jgi:hypothetical protein
MAEAGAALITSNPSEGSSMTQYEENQESLIQELTVAEIEQVSGGLAAPWDYSGDFSYCSLYTSGPFEALRCHIN